MNIINKVTVGVSLLTLVLMGSNNLPKNNENTSGLVQSNYETSEQLYLKNNSGELDESDIYDLFSMGDSIYYIPLKAIGVSHATGHYTVLSDGQGSMYIVKEILKENQNYIGRVYSKNDTLLNYEESDFEFSYKEDFENTKRYEIDWGLEQLDNGLIQDNYMINDKLFLK